MDLRRVTMDTVADPVDPRTERFERFVRATETPLALLALLMVPALVLEDHAKDLNIRELAVAINWFVWLAVCAEYGIKLTLAPSRRSYAVRGWFDLLIIVLSPPFLVPQGLQGVRAERALRILRLLRFIRAAAMAALGLRLAADALEHRHYVALTTAGIVGLGTSGVFAVEHGPNPNITTVGDALRGRFFFEQERSAESLETEARLTRIEARVDELLRVPTLEDVRSLPNLMSAAPSPNVERVSIAPIA
jgi:hypothetical protein